MQAKTEKFDCVTHPGSYLALELEGPGVPLAPNCVRQVLRVPASMYPKTLDHHDDHASMQVMFTKLCNMINAYPGLKHAADELEKTLEWLKTGKVDGVVCERSQVVENITKALTQLQI